MEGSSTRQLLSYCETISAHSCLMDNSNCNSYRQAFPSMLAFTSSLGGMDMSDSSFGENIIASGWDGLISKMNSNVICIKCELFSRCFLCWLIVSVSKRTSSSGGLLLQYVEIVLKSTQRCLRSEREDILLRNFEQLLRLFHGHLCQRYINEALSPYRLKVSLSLASLNVEIGRIQDAEMFLIEAENQVNNFPKKVDDVLVCYCSLISSLSRKTPPVLDDMIRFAEKCHAFMERHNSSSTKKRIRIVKFLAIATARKGDFETALRHIISAETMEPVCSFDLLLARFRILIMSTAAAQTDFGQLASSMQEIVCSSDFSVRIGIQIVRELFEDKQKMFAEHFLSLMWQSLGKSLKINAEILPFFVYRLRQCLHRCDVPEIQKMFLLFDERPFLLSEMPQEIGLKICSLLNRHAVMFVKTHQFENALSYYQLCDNLMCGVPSIAESVGRADAEGGPVKSAPSLPQIKRSLALCQFQVGRLQECQQTLRDAETLEDSPWIHFIWFYMSVKMSTDSAAVESLHKIFFSAHCDAPALLDLSSSVALTENKPILAMTALEYRVNDYFDKRHSSDSESSDSSGNVLSAIKTLIRLKLKMSINSEDVTNCSYKQFSEESLAFADYMGKACGILTRVVHSAAGNSSKLNEDIKWFSEVCWHISNKTNGLMMKMEQTKSWKSMEDSSDDFEVSARLTLFTLYRRTADIISLLYTVTRSASDPVSGTTLLQKYCLCLSLCLASGVQYLRLLKESDQSRTEFAASLLKSLKECQKVVDVIASERGGKRDAVPVSCGGMSMLHTLAIFEFEIVMNLENFEDAQAVMQKFADEYGIFNEVPKLRGVSAENYIKCCVVFERFAKMAQDCAVRFGSLGLNCENYFGLCLRSLNLALSSYSAAEIVSNGANNDSLNERVKALSSCIRGVYHSCRQYARDTFFAKNSELFGLVNQLTTTTATFWKRVPPSETEWIVSVCWNCSLDRRIRGLKEDCKAWYTVAQLLAENCADKKMLLLLREKLNSLKKWEGLESGDDDCWM